MDFDDWPCNEFTNWQWQLQHRITTVDELSQYLDLTDEEARDIQRAGEAFMWAITPYYASLMDRSDSNCPIRKQAVPSIEELSGPGLSDPLEEEVKSPVPGLIHRYPDRVAFTVSSHCAMYCRHCTRKRFVGEPTFRSTQESIRQGLEYIKSHPEIRDVLITGGDPLLASDEWIDELLGSIRRIEHVEIIRIGTRVVCTLPFRITKSLCRVLEKHHPIWINTHFNHPKELTPQAAQAVDRLLRAGIPVGNQSVLLRGINDDPEVMKKLVQGLVKIRVRPYYLYQCDRLQGTAHFWTAVDKGLQIIRSLQGYTTGFAVPTFVVDTPVGKIPLHPNNVVAKNGYLAVTNYEGEIWKLPLEDGQLEELKN